MLRLAAFVAPALLASACALAPAAAPSVGPLALIEAERRGHLDVEAPPAEVGSFVLRGATIHTVAGATHADGAVVVRDGRVVWVGAGAPPEALAAGLPVEDGAGHHLTPGLIDVHSHLGVYASPSIGATRDGNEMTGPMTAGVWAEHSFWPEDPGLERALRGGVTTLHVLPGSGNLIGGRGVTLRLRPTRGARAMRFPGAPDSVKMACGENPKRVYGGRGSAPSTRMGNARGYREAFIAAEKYRKDTTSKAFGEAPRDLAMETLVGLLDGRILAQVHCYTAQDLVGFLQVADEFGFKVKAFHHALEAYKVRELLVARDIAVATWADWWGFKLEGWDGIPQNAGLLEVAGGRPIIHSDSGEGIQRLNQEAAKALRAAREAGLAVDPEAALRWVTQNAAWALGLEAEVGSIQIGRRADLVLWDGPPLSVYAKPSRIWIDGARVLDTARNEPAAPWSDFEAGLSQLRPTPPTNTEAADAPR
jgi:imidazolonepropionase-like amidohydrolase